MRWRGPGFTPDPDSDVRFVGDLDHGLEACENDLLAAIAPGGRRQTAPSP